MPFSIAARRLGLIIGVVLAGSLLPAAFAAEQGAIAGYADYKELARQVEALAKPGLCEVGSLGTTLGGRKIFVVTIGTGKTADKPAILVVGNVHAPQLLGSELAVRIARRLIGRSATDAAAKELLERYTFYIIPRPSPDASEAFFQKPLREREGNLHVIRDERDPDADRDPAEDLNHDGLITMMRVADDAGHWRMAPDDSRAMITADPQKGEHGQYERYVEGRHDDSAPRRSAGADGVAFNRNFPFRYPHYKPLAGPNAVSEIETRAVADFAFDHPNIAVVFCFSPEDNLLHPWKPQREKGPIFSALMPEDAAEFEYVAEKFRTIVGGTDAPPSPPGEGSFSEWAYFHYGRWSFASRGWWVPKVGEAKPQAAADAKEQGKPKANADQPDGGKYSAGDEGIDPVNALRWLDRENIDGFVPWTRIEHPDFPGRKVEVGGFKPFVLINPPARLLDPIAEKQTDFVLELARLMPQVKIADARAEPLGGGIQRITATVSNPGYLPTSSEMGQTTGEIYPLILKLVVPKGTQFLKGAARGEIERIRGGGKTQSVWLIRLPDGKPGSATVSVSSPSVGSDTKTLELK